MALATLSIDLVAKLAALQAGMDRAGRIAEQQAAQITQRFAAMRTAAMGVGAGLAASLSVAGIAQFIRSTNDGLLAIKDLSEATGATIENISGLENVARAAGGSLADASGVLIKFNAALKEADGKNGVSQALKAIGLDAAELRRQDPAVALQNTAKALALYADDGNKARLVQELFGKSVKEAAPLLKELAEAGGLAASVTARQVEEADKFDKQLARLKARSEDAARAIAGPLVASLNDFFRVLERARGNPEGFFAGIGDKFRTDFLQARLQATNDEIARIASDAQRAQQILNRQPDSIRAKATLAEYAELQRAAANYRAEIERIKFSGLARRPANEGGGSLALPALPDLAGSRTAARIPALQAPVTRTPLVTPLPDSTLAALRALEQTDVAKIAELNATLDALFAMRAGGAGGGPEVDEAIERVRTQLQALSPAAQQAAADQARLNAILAQTPTGQLAAVREQIEFINAQFAAGKIENVEQWAQAVRNTTAQLGQGAQEQVQQISTFAEQASRNIQDSLGDTLVQVMQGSTQNIGKLWRDMLNRMVAQAAAVKLNEVLFGKNFGSPGVQLGGWLGGLFGGGATPAATGLDYVPKDNFPALLHRGERVLTARESKAYAAGAAPQLVYSPTINVNGDVSQQTLVLVRAEVQRGLQRFMRLNPEF